MKTKYTLKSRTKKTRNDEIMELKSIIQNALKKKSPDELIAVSKKSELKKTLNVFDLIVLGIGAVVGTGIFTIIGSAIQGGPESAGAGPAIVISMVLAAVACVFQLFVIPKLLQ